eukprot:GSChrysophyteH2.ASY1.ANO1.1289.1 assembled CDS
MPLASRARPAQPRSGAGGSSGSGSGNTGKWDLQGREEKPEKPLGRAPKARVCYICGRQYMVHSFPIHEKQCIKLFEDREAQKPKKQRKSVPQDPITLLKSQAQARGRPKHLDGEVLGQQQLDFSLDAINAASQTSYSSATLSKCMNCDRTFLPEKLVKHNKMCTRANPARRVGQKVSVDLKAEVATLEASLGPSRMAPRAGRGNGGGNSSGGGRGSDTGSGSGPSTNWRSKSGAFRAAIQYVYIYCGCLCVSLPPSLSVMHIHTNLSLTPLLYLQVRQKSVTR